MPMVLSFMMLVAVSIAVHEHWNRLFENERAWQGLFWKWLAQGVGIPLFVWCFVNLGFIDSFPALPPHLAWLQANNKVWWNVWTKAAIDGAVFIGLAWGAITYIWLIFVIAQRAENTAEFRVTLLTVGIPMFLLALIVVYRGPWSLLPVGLLAVFLPLVHCTMHQAEKPAPVASYGKAIGQMKFGKYEDAEIEVINQLERKENDFQGWMMLAELYATKYRRLDDASQVIVDLCNDPSIQPVEISLACNKLADWHLEIAANPLAARAALDLLIKRVPGTHFANMAEIRLKQIPRTREDLLDKKSPRPIRLPSLREDFQEPVTAEEHAAQRRDATAEANRLTARLQDNPNDNEARERLAILLAEKLGHIKLGMEQLRLMIHMVDNDPESRAKWLAQIGNWERRLNKNEIAFIALLNEIIRDFPKTSQAYSARRQLQLLENEALEKANPPAPLEVKPLRLKVENPNA